MRLSVYPDAIAKAAEAVNLLDRRIGEVRQDIVRLEGKADLVVAFEVGLKNEDQRKARRFQILQDNPEYRLLQEALLQLTMERSNAIVQLERLRDQFSVAKLDARLAIAEKLTALESRELVGL
jgi:hypothetical protein